MPDNQKPRIGVYVCHCGGNISGTVDCEQVADALGRHDGVVVARTNESFCSDAGQSIIEQDIKEHGVNRIVVGACAPMLHEQTFRGTVVRAGLNPYFYHHVGLREQDSWVHGHDKAAATDKAIRLMAAGVAKSRLLAPLDPIRLVAEQHVLVIGGGVAGLRAALDLAQQGLRVSLVEKSPYLGGRMAQLETVFPTEEEARSLLGALIQQVVAHPNITVFTQEEVVEVLGYVGNFTIRVRQHSRGVSPENAEAFMAACPAETEDDFNYGLSRRKVIYRPYPGCYPDLPAVDWDAYDGRPFDVGGTPVVLKDEPRSFELNVGAIVVATGFDPYTPAQGEYGFGRLPQVVTLPQMIRLLALAPKGQPLMWQGREVREVALIHCVGSRQIEGVHPPQADGRVNDYCSRVCCTAALHTAAEMKKRFPDMTIYDLHQDIRTYGHGHEEYYLRTQEQGVRFLRFKGEEGPTVCAAPKGDSHPVLVNIKDMFTYNEEIELAVDLVVLAVGMMPRDILDLVSKLKVSQGNDRFLLEVHPKLRPVETSVTGVVLAGSAQGPMNIQESISAASAAAAKVVSLLGRGKVELPPFVARVDPHMCEGTGACVQVCLYDGAIALESVVQNGVERQRAVITPANCVGCGACVSACPNHAIDVQGWTLAQYDAMVEALGMGVPAEEEVAA